MKQFKRFTLDRKLTHEFFIDNLLGTNILSSSLIELVDFKSGCFFTFLPNEADPSKIHKFRTGGLPGGMRDQMAPYIFEKLASNYAKFCVFDDYENTYEKDNMGALFNSYGVEIKKEVYYIISQKNASIELINKCLFVSDVIWHSLCVLTNTSISNLSSKKLASEEVNDICKEAKLIILGAYDEEGYIFWEKLEN